MIWKRNLLSHTICEFTHFKNLLSSFRSTFKKKKRHNNYASFTRQHFYQCMSGDRGVIIMTILLCGAVVLFAVVMSLRFGPPHRVKVAFVSSDKLVVCEFQCGHNESESYPRRYSSVSCDVFTL